jgi:hypothetical protein
MENVKSWPNLLIHFCCWILKILKKSLKSYIKKYGKIFQYSYLGYFIKIFQTLIKYPNTKKSQYNKINPILKNMEKIFNIHFHTSITEANRRKSHLILVLITVSKWKKIAYSTFISNRKRHETSDKLGFREIILKILIKFNKTFKKKN